MPARYFLAALCVLIPFSLHAADWIGDGVADDTRAIQATIDSGKGMLLLPAGTYRITKTLEFDLAKLGSFHVRGVGRVRIVMDGAGPAIRLTGTHGGTAAPNTVTEEIWNRQNAPLVSGLEIVGAHPDADGVELDGTMQPTLHDLTIRKTRHAIHLVKRNRNVIVRDCHLYENTGVGLFLDDVNLHQINVTGSHISYNAEGGIVSRDGNVRNLHITGCDIEGNMGDADAPPTANVLLVSGKGSIGEVAITGCTIQHTHEAKDSANIRIDLQSEAVKHTQELRHGNITITGNVLSDVQVNIHLANVRGAAIAGNTIWKGYESNVLLENCDVVSMTGNTMDRNPRYHYGDGGDAKLGVVLKNCTRCVLSSCLINGVGDREGALELIGCREVSVSGCTIDGYSKHGVVAKNSTRCLLDNNLIGGDSKVALKNCDSMIVDAKIGLE